MFKRLREGLFKRSEESSQEAAESQQPELPEDTWMTGVEETPEATHDEETQVAAREVDSSKGAVETVNPLPEAAAPPEAAAAVDTRVELTPTFRAEPEEAWPEEEGEDADAGRSDEQSGKGFWSNPFRFSLGRTRQLFGRVNEALSMTRSPMSSGMSWKRHLSGAMSAYRRRMRSCRHCASGSRPSISRVDANCATL